MNTDPTKEEMQESLRNYMRGLWTESDEELEDEIEVAIYYFARDYHSGQSSNLYSALSTSPYSPGMSDELGEGGSLDDLYLHLVSEFSTTLPYAMYQVINYDVWGNPEDGYEVNDAHYTGLEIEISCIDTDEQIIEKLIDAGFCNDSARGELETDDQISDMHYSIYLNETVDGKPFCELQRSKDNEN